jgi:MFS family permease
VNPIHLTLATAVVAFSGITSARVQLSLYALELGAGPSEVGLLFTTIFLFPLLLSWPIGRWADRIGSRGLLMLGQATGVIGMIIPWAVPKLYALYIAGLLSGLCFAFTSVLILNVMGLLSKPQDRARNFANNSLMGSLSNVLGPLIAGFAIDHAGFGIASLCSAGLSLAALVLLAVWGSSFPGGSGARAPAGKGTLGERLSDRVAVGIILVSCLAQVGGDLFSLYLPIYGHGLGLSASVIGTILASFFVGAATVRIVLPQLILRLGENKLLTYALFVAAAGFLLMPLFAHPVMLGLVSFGFGMGIGCAQPITMMLLFNRAPEGRSGETVALRQTANNIARVVTPPVFGFIAAATGLWGVFMLSAALMGAGGWAMRSRMAMESR